CDDGNTSDGDGCPSTCNFIEGGYDCISHGGFTSLCTHYARPFCGDGHITDGEECDPMFLAGYPHPYTWTEPGCDSTCHVVSGFICERYVFTAATLYPYTGCAPICGDGILIDAPDVLIPEQCDDHNNRDGDGCSSTCLAEGDQGICPDGEFEPLVGTCEA